MRSRFRHIALLLFLVYTVPVIYQNLHVVHHHSIKNYFDPCQSGHSDRHSDNLCFKEYDRCPVCDFTFSLNIVHSVLNLDTKAFYYTGLISCQENSGYVTLWEDHIKPRAPPVL